MEMGLDMKDCSIEILDHSDNSVKWERREIPHPAAGFGMTRDSIALTACASSCRQIVNQVGTSVKGEIEEESESWSNRRKRQKRMSE